ncbi:MAG: lysozyme [Lachnospiraceae bacterium]|nr:lysozyme [Lachnospiraceae bacterium]
MGIREGDIVTISSVAVYYSGKAMPDWVKNDKWIVKSVTGDMAILGKNVSGSNDINSPVNIKYLNVGGQSQQSSAMEQNFAGSQKNVANSRNAAVTGEMSVSDRGVELIAKYEGCRLEAYKCPAGVWTIGYGHTEGVQQGQTLPSVEAAKALLKQDLKKYGGYVNNCVKKGLITFPLTQNQFDALTSFCYNCGNGSLQTLVSGRDASTVADKLLLYNKAGGKVLAGLTKRREEERALFLV